VLSEFFKRHVRPRLVPLARAYVRYFPLAIGKRLLWRTVIGPRLFWVPRDFVATTRTGTRLAGNTRDKVQAHIYYFGVWEPNLTRFLGERLAPGDVFVDVGANIGYCSLLAAPLVGESGKVVAIEASPTLFSALRDNLERNGARNVRAVNKAAADKAGKLKLYLGPPDNLGMTSVLEDSVAGSSFECEVDALPLAEILSTDEIATTRIIKVDVEGAEAVVARGMAPLLSKCREDLEVVIEVSPERLASQSQSVDEIVGLFADAGFHAYALANDTDPLAYLPPIRLERPVRIREATREQIDIVFSRKDQESL
jgi:FkbM family methyltransferase